MCHICTNIHLWCASHVELFINVTEANMNVPQCTLYPIGHQWSAHVSMSKCLCYMWIFSKTSILNQNVCFQWAKTESKLCDSISFWPSRQWQKLLFYHHHPRQHHHEHHHEHHHHRHNLRGRARASWWRRSTSPSSSPVLFSSSPLLTLSSGPLWRRLVVMMVKVMVMKMMVELGYHHRHHHHLWRCIIVIVIMIQVICQSLTTPGQSDVFKQIDRQYLQPKIVEVSSPS